MFRPRSSQHTATQLIEKITLVLRWPPSFPRLPNNRRRPLRTSVRAYLGTPNHVQPLAVPNGKDHSFNAIPANSPRSRLQAEARKSFIPSALLLLSDRQSIFGTQCSSQSNILAK